MSVYENEYTIDPTSGRYKKSFGSNIPEPVTGKRKPSKTYITFAGIKFYY